MINTHSWQRLEVLTCAGFAGALLAFLIFYAVAPITDPDFWWHLKSGEVMVQNGGLLQSDPFTFTSDGVTSTRESLILKSYWLWQLTAYGLYTLLGFNGIFLLNFFTVLAMVGVVSQQMHRQQVSCFLAILLLTLGFYLVRTTYALERPQVVSFLFATIIFGFIAHVRDGGRLGWLLPLVMVVWANLHGGFVVGDLILICFAAGAIIEYRQDLPRLRSLLCWVALGIGASLLNPNGGLAFAELLTFHNSALMSGVSEYQSTWTKLQQGSWSIVILWLLIVLHGIGIWKARRFYWPEFVAALFIAYFSVSYIRNIGFFAVAMLPSIGFYLQQGFARHTVTSPNIIKYLLVVFASATFLWQANIDRNKTESISAAYPERSAEFILTSGLQGKMFNGYTFGGYLLWKLYPQHLVFIDGRGLDADVYLDWKAMTSASLKEVEGRKEFEVLLDRYGIDYVVQSHIFYDTGRLTPLLKFLLIKPDWSPVYVDPQGYILARNSQLNAAVIERHGMEKGEFNNKVVAYLTHSCNAWPAEVVNHVALAELLIFVGRYAEAEKRLEVITRLQPNNPDLPSLKNQLAVLKNGKRP